MVILDPYLKEINKFVGNPDPSLPSYDIPCKKPHFSGETSKIMWFGGKGQLMEVNLEDLSMINHRTLAVCLSEYIYSEPIATIADFQRFKYLALSNLEGEQILIYGENKIEPDPLIMTKAFPFLSEATCIDISKNKLHGFIGGFLEIPSISKKGVMASFMFERSLRVTSVLELPQENATEVTCIRQCNLFEEILLVGSNGPIFVVSFIHAQRTLGILRVIELDNISLVHDICIHDDKIYASGEIQNGRSAAIFIIKANQYL